MEQRLSLVTLGVADIERSRTFYAQLGWHGQTVDETVFFQAGSIGVVLWSRDKLAQDAGVDDMPTAGFGGITLAHNVHNRSDVDTIVAAASDAGATVTSPPADTVYGCYAGSFLDPDGHVSEIAHNPGFPLDEDGALTIPDFGDETTTAAARQNTSKVDHGISRIVPDLATHRPGEVKDFYTGLLGLDVAMDHGWVTSLVSQTHGSAQILIIDLDKADHRQPDISVEVDDVDAVHASATGVQLHRAQERRRRDPASRCRGHSAARTHGRPVSRRRRRCPRPGTDDPSHRQLQTRKRTGVEGSPPQPVAHNVGQDPYRPR